VASDEDINQPNITLKDSSGATLTNVVVGSGSNWFLDYTVVGGIADGDVSFAIGFMDPAGNAGAEVTTVTAGDVVEIDTALNVTTTPDVTAPALLSAIMYSSNSLDNLIAKDGDNVILEIATNENINSPVVSFTGLGGSPIVSGNNKNWTISQQVLAADPDGPIAFTLDFTDLAGNAGTQVTSVSAGSAVTIDNSAASLTSVILNSNNLNNELAKAGDTITLSVIADDDIIPIINLMNLQTTSLPASVTGSNASWQATYTVSSNDIEGDVLFSIDFTDSSGNAGTASSTTDGSAVEIDHTSPSGSSLNISSNNANDDSLAKAGDMITIDFTAQEEILKPNISLFSSSGSSLITSVSGSGAIWTATYAVNGSEADGLSTFKIDFKDLARNSSQLPASGNGSAITIDNTAPTLTQVTLNSSNSSDPSVASSADIITLGIEADEKITVTSVSILDAGSNTLASSFSGAGTVWSATYSVTGSDPSGGITFAIDFHDEAGNLGVQVSSTTDSSVVAIDNTTTTLAPTTTTTAPPTTTLPPDPDLTPAGGGIHLDCIRAVGSQLRKNYISENINYSDVLTTTLEIGFTSGKKVTAVGFTEDLERWKDHIDSFNLAPVGEWYAGGFGLYGLTFKNAKIVSVDFPTRPQARENGVFGAKITMVIEERQSGDLDNISISPYYKTIHDQLSLHGHLIEDLSEDFEFTKDKGGQYGFTHTVNLRLLELNSGGFAATQAIAQMILNPPIDPLPAFGFAFNAGMYATFAPSIAPYYSESMDLASGNYSITKTFKTYSDMIGNEPSYTYELTHSMAQDASGITSITENGKVKAQFIAPMGAADTAWAEGGRFKYAKDGVTALLVDAYTRCESFYSGGLWPNQAPGKPAAAPFFPYQGDGLDPDTNTGVWQALRPQPVSITRNLDGVSQECSYSVTYTDDPAQSWTTALGQNVRRESVISSTQDSSGNIIISENVDMIQVGEKGTVATDMLDILSEDHGLAWSEGGVAGAATANKTFGGMSNWNLQLGSRARIEHFYNNIYVNRAIATDYINSWIPKWKFKFVSFSLSHAYGHKTGNYSVEFSSDPDIFEPAQDGIKRLTLSTEDVFAHKTKQEYNIPQWKVLIHDPNQTSLHVRTVTAGLTLERGYYQLDRLANPKIPTDSLVYAAGVVRTKILALYTDQGLLPVMYPGQGLPLHYLASCDYSFDSKGGASLTATLNSVQKL
jgi:hypothetical protein